MRRRGLDNRTGASVLVYVVLLAFSLFEQWGRTTSDTKTPLIENPASFLRGATTLWDPSTDFGQLQNQAYGYLWPQGPFFLLGQALHLPPWIVERLWSVLVVVVAAEGLRRLAGAVGLGPWAAWVAGMSYGLSPRILSQVGVRSAELLPTAVLPWAALPIVLAICGRLSARRAVLLSSAAFVCGGAVNATATAAGLPLIAILLVWGVRRRALPRSAIGWWLLATVVTNVWWAAALLRLRTYSPPFFDFVEDARTTTETTGYAATLRGLSNWVGYTYLGSSPNWPAGFRYAFEPWLVLVSGLLAAIGAVGLVRLARPWRTPLVLSAVLGVVLVTIAHASALQSPLAGPIRDLLDGDLALLRNVSKADSLLRLPLCLGIGAVHQRLGAGLVAGAGRPRLRTLSRVAVVVAVLASAQPVVAMQLRTRGWTATPEYWSQAAAFLARAGGERRAWLVPGTGFALQDWGWTMDEPFQDVGRTPWVTRSQIPLAPPQTIRILSQLERFLESGSGSPNLGVALGRLGLGYVVVRHDLDEAATDTTTSNLVSIALARSRGVERVRTFGALDFGPAIEVFRVTAPVSPPLQVRPLAEVRTVAGASSDVIEAVVAGVLGPDRAAVVRGDPVGEKTWTAPADIVGDSYRDRERSFGRVHDAEGPVRAPGEPRRGGRVVADYPANAGSRPVQARYVGGAAFTASSSQAWTDGIGRVAPESAPYSAFDGDDQTGWRSAYAQRARGQWVEARWPSARTFGTVRISQPVGDERYADVTRWRVTIGRGKDSLTRTAEVDPFTGLAQVDLGPRSARTLRVTADAVRGSEAATVRVLEVSSEATPVARSLVVPPTRLGPDPSYVFTAQPETRACITTLLGADCAASRQAASEESSGIARTFDVAKGGRFALTGTAVARSSASTNALLEPIGSQVAVRASSQWLSDPAVSVRLAYDGSSTTSWVADPRDPRPTLTVDFDRPRVVDRILVVPPGQPAVRPTSAVLRTREGDVRRVVLGEFGRFAPVRTRRLTITFSNPTRGQAPLGLSELGLPPARTAVPLDGGASTGAVCGFGPTLVVDGRHYRTRVSGYIGDVVSAGPLRIEPCSGPIPLAAGRHRLLLRSTPQFQPVSALLDPTTRVSVTSSGRRLSRVTGSDTDQSVRVGPGPASMLSTTRNVNPGWRATLDGEVLEPMISDGWAQAWRLPAGRGGRVVITYGPQQPYLVGLYGGLVLLGLVLLAALVALLRLRLEPAREVPEARPTSPRQRIGRQVAAVPLSWVLGGVPALVGVVVALVVRRPRLLARIALAALVAAPVLVAWQLRDGPRLRFDAADAIAGIGFALACWSGLSRSDP